MKLIRRKPVHAVETFPAAVRKVEQGCVSENGHAPIAEPIMIATSTPRSTFSRLFAARRPCHNVAYGPRAIVFMPSMNTSPSFRTREDVKKFTIPVSTGLHTARCIGRGQRLSSSRSSYVLLAYRRTRSQALITHHAKRPSRGGSHDE